MRNTPWSNIILGALLGAVAAQAVEPAQNPKPAYTPANYRPDYPEYDIYSVHVDRTYLPTWWKLKLLRGTEENPPDDAGERARYYASEFDDRNWPDQVIAHPWNFALGEKWKRAEHREFAGVGWYRVSFTAPRNPARLRAILNFGEVNSESTVYLNGKKIGFHKNTNSEVRAFHLDVTEQLRFGGANMLALRVFDDGKSARRSIFSEGGVTGRVYLDLRPAVWCRHVLVTPDKDLEGLRYDGLLTASEEIPAQLTGWTVDVFEWKSGNVAGRAKAGELRRADNGDTFLTGRVSVPNAKPWSCESPFLYGIRLRNEDGQLAGVQRFGMRTFEAVGKHFLLNGKPTYLRGWVKHAHSWDGLYWKSYMFQFNERNAMYRYFKSARDANLNHIRLHTSFLRPPGYDVLDELGILVTDELASYGRTPIKNPVSGVEIMHYGIDAVSTKDGNLRPAFVRQVTERLYRSYSHPSIGTFSFGNEMRTGSSGPKVAEGIQMRKMFNHLYDLYTSLDLQNRPITPSSGRYWGGKNDWRGMGIHREGDKLDYIDVHDYTGSGPAKPLKLVDRQIEDTLARIRELWPDGIPPLVNGETGAMWSNHYREFDPIWSSAEAETVNYPELTDALKTAFKLGHTIGTAWAANAGTKAYNYFQPKARGWQIARLIDSWRKYWPATDGFEFMTGPFFDSRARFPLERSTFAPNAAYRPIQQASAPLVIIVDYPPPNRYADDTVKLKTYVINNDEQPRSNLKAEFRLLNGPDTVWRKTVPVGTMGIGAKSIAHIDMKIPQLNGVRLTFNYLLTDGEKVYCDRLLHFNVRDRNAVFVPPAVTRAVKLYEPEPAATGSAAELLQAYGVKFQVLNAFSGLSSGDLLVIGPGNLGEAPPDRLARFVSGGGHLLVLPQGGTRKGVLMPLIERGKILIGTGMHFSEILDSTSPLLRGMGQSEFRCWNHPGWAVYSSIVAPLSRYAVLLGGNQGSWRGPNAFGSVLADVPMGRGRMVFCQAQIHRCFAEDSGAGQLARNILLELAR